MTNYLITGGAGFIGSNFINYMLKRYNDCKIICLDNLTYAGNLLTLNSALDDVRFNFIKGDISDKECVFNIFKKNKIDIVVNFAAESHVDRSIEDASLFLKTNVIGTQVLLDAAKRFGIERFHQISTDEVYGELPLNRSDLLFNENSPIKASSPYSVSKASADLLVFSYFRTYNLPISISRCSNNYGPYQYPEKLIPLTILKALRNEGIPIYGNGMNVRDWIYVNDHCSALDTIINDGKIGEVYNIGGNSEKTNLDVVRIILRELNKSENLIKFVKDRLGHDLRYAINTSKINSDLHWYPSTKFENGIKQTIQWYVNNIVWLKNIVSLR